MIKLTAFLYCHHAVCASSIDMASASKKIKMLCLTIELIIHSQSLPHPASSPSSLPTWHPLPVPPILLASLANIFCWPCCMLSIWPWTLVDSSVRDWPLYLCCRRCIRHCYGSKRMRRLVVSLTAPCRPALLSLPSFMFPLLDCHDGGWLTSAKSPTSSLPWTC